MAELVFRDGFLEKLGYGSGKYQKRYFRLFADRLEYYKQPTDGKPKGVIRFVPHTDCKAVNPGELPNITATDTIWRPKRAMKIPEHCLSVCDTVNGRVYYLVAQSAQDRDDWVSSICGQGNAFTLDKTGIATGSADGPDDPLEACYDENGNVILKYLKRGHLLKLGFNSGKWQNRYFVLVKEKLIYYGDDHSKRKPRGVVHYLPDAQCQILEPGSKIQPGMLGRAQSAVEAIPENTFTVKDTITNRIFVLVATNSAHRDEWIEVIEEQGSARRLSKAMESKVPAVKFDDAVKIEEFSSDDSSEGEVPGDLEFEPSAEVPPASDHEHQEEKNGSPGDQPTMGNTSTSEDKDGPSHEVDTSESESESDDELSDNEVAGHPTGSESASAVVEDSAPSLEATQSASSEDESDNELSDNDVDSVDGHKAHDGSKPLSQEDATTTEAKAESSPKPVSPDRADEASVDAE